MGVGWTASERRLDLRRNLSIHLPTRRLAVPLSSVTHGVKECVDPQGVSIVGELVEKFEVLGLPFPRIPDIRVVTHQDHDAALWVTDGAEVRGLGFLPALRGGR